MTALVERKKQKSVAVLYGNRSEYPSQHGKKKKRNNGYVLYELILFTPPAVPWNPLQG